MAKTAPEISMPFIQLNKQSRKALYVQLYEEIRTAVLNGILKPGDRMPATRMLSKELSIARNSVILAYEQLILEGYLGGKTGAGTYVAGIPDQPEFLQNHKSVLETQTGGFLSGNSLAGKSNLLFRDCDFESIRTFQISVPSFADFPFKTWAKIAAAIYKDIGALHLGYDHGQGYEPLRAAIAAHLRINRSINCTAEQVVVVNGSRQAIHLIAELFLKQGDQCWMEDPGYTGAKSAMQRFGAEVCPVPIGENGLDIDYAIEQFPNAKLAYITPSHQYPMGITMPLQERLKLLAYARRQNMIIIEDDYDSEFRYNGRPLAALKGIDTHGNVLYVGTFSKILFPALRIGYMVLPSAALAQEFTYAKALTDRQNPVIDQAILNEFIRSGHFQRHLRKMRTLYKKAQDDLSGILLKELGENVKVYPAEAGMHFVLQFKQQHAADLIKQDGGQSGLILTPLDKLSVKFHHHSGFLMGFTGYSLEEMEKGVQLIKKITRL
jgi:GntR family transcriptional regulator/MocR family aminotransferase